MTKDERQQSLIAARKACEWLRTYFKDFHQEPFEQEVTHLLIGFEILDDKEQKQIRAGKRYGRLGAEHGRKGGRPRKANNGGKK